MTKLVAVLCLFSAVFLISEAGEAFSYRVELEASSDPCEVHAQKLGQMFLTYTGAQVQSSQCKERYLVTDNGQVFTKDVVVIYYRSAKQVHPVRVVFGGREFLSRSFADVGLFGTYSECMKALPEQSEEFQKNLGFPVFAATCKAPDNTLYPGYSLVLEGFGVGKKNLHHFSTAPFITLGSVGVSGINSAAKEIIEKSGGSIVLTDNNNLFYYREYGPTMIAHSIVGSLYLPLECEKEMPAAQEILTRAGPGQALCADSRLIFVYQDRGVMAETVSNEGLYRSYDSCVEDKLRITQNLEGSGRKILGAICRPATYHSKYEMALFYRRY